MQIDEAVKRTGSFGLAVVVAFDELEEEFFDSLDFSQLIEVCQNAYHRPEIRKILFPKIISAKKTFSQLENFYNNTDDRDEKQAILQEMLKCAEFFKEWYSLLNKLLADSEDWFYAFENMRASATTFTEKKIVFYYSSDKDKSRTFEEMKELASDFKGKYWVCLNSKTIKEKQEAFKEMLGFIEKDEDRLIIIEHFSFGECYGRIDIGPIIRGIKSTPKLVALLGQCARKRLGNEILQSLNERIIDVRAWIACLEADGESNPRINKFLIDKLDEVVIKAEDLVLAYNSVSKESTLSEHIFNRISEAIKSGD